MLTILNLNNNILFFYILIFIIAILLLLVNILLSTSNNYNEKSGSFECGFTSFQQTRISFSISFIILAILFLPFDLEISSILPYSINIYYSNTIGIFTIIIFIFILLLGFIYEYNNNTLVINKYNIKSINYNII